MLFYAQLQQMDGKWNDKWTIMVRKWMKDMSISDGKMDNSRAQHLPQTKLVACPHATQYLCSIQLEKLIHLFFILLFAQLQLEEMKSLIEIGRVT